MRAPLDVTFDALLEQLGPYNEVAENRPLPMKLEPWPGGRWYRDLGDNNGHLWGHVQAIKRPTLLEINGPLIMSYPVTNNLQYRLSKVEGGTLIRFHHLALGPRPRLENSITFAMSWFTALRPEIRDSSPGLATELPHYTGAGSPPCALRHFLSPQ